MSHLWLPQFWLDEHHSDAIITIESVSGSCTLPGHQVLLSAASSYFAIMLSPTWSNDGRDIADTSGGRLRTIRLTLDDPEDLPAMIALLKCIYTNTIHLETSDLAAVLATSTPAAGEALALASRFDGGTCWQDLAIRVLQLADRFAVPGAVAAAASKLSALFSYQLSWQAVLAVLWLPTPGLGQQPALQQLRQMAVNRVTQDLMHLDPCLASSRGRHLLQLLPPDTLASLLGSDLLALVSENSVVAAIDVWAAGPVAASLAVAGTGSSSSGGSGSSAARLEEALELLAQRVRLPLCSGAFLAAGVRQRPWLSRAMSRRQELQLMQQYYSSDAQGRYDLAMQLLHSGRSCPWSVMLRRGSPSSFSTSTSSSIFSSGSNQQSSSESLPEAIGVVEAHTRLSQLRAVLEGAEAAPAPAPAAASGERAICGRQPCKHQQQPRQGRGWPGSTASSRGSILLMHRVFGGCIWQAELVAVPAENYTTSSRIDVQQGAEAAGDGSDVSCKPAGSSHLQQQQGADATLLCLAVSCRPAWADALENYSSSRPSSSSSGGGGGGGMADHCEGPAATAGAAAAAGCFAPSCACLWAIAEAKAKEAVARHAPVPAARFPGSAAPPAAPDAAADCRLDVVIGMQLVATATRDQLQQLTPAVGGGSGSNMSAGPQPAQCYLPCLLPWDAGVGAACGLLPIDVAGIGRSINLLAAGGSRPTGAAGAAAGAGAGGGGQQQWARLTLPGGWQPEVWSALAPNGLLHWQVNLRQLMD